jgi:hypothetical protein
MNSMIVFDSDVRNICMSVTPAALNQAAYGRRRRHNARFAIHLPEEEEMNVDHCHQDSVIGSRERQNAGKQPKQEHVAGGKSVLLRHAKVKPEVEGEAEEGEPRFQPVDGMKDHARVEQIHGSPKDSGRPVLRQRAYEQVDEKARAHVQQSLKHERGMNGQRQALAKKKIERQKQDKPERMKSIGRLDPVERYPIARSGILGYLKIIEGIVG